MSDHNFGNEAIREGEPPYARHPANTPLCSSTTWLHYAIKRRRILILSAAVSFPALMFTVWWCSVRFTGPAVVYDALVGQMEDQIRREYGPPVSDDPGYHSLGAHDPPPLPGPMIRSLAFRPGILFHPKGGTLCVWLVQQDGKWLCFQSCWYADDVRF
jgi:hypothetical protein